MYIFITIYIIKGSAYTKIIAYKDRMSHLYITHTGVKIAEGNCWKRNCRSGNKRVKCKFKDQT